MCNVCVCNSTLSRLRIWCGNPGLGTGSYGCQKEGSWVTEPLQAPVTKVAVETWPHVNLLKVDGRSTCSSP